MTDPEVGTLAEETRRLVQALATWIESRSPGSAAPTHVYAGDWADARPPGGRPVTCRYCPMCQAIALAGGQRPDVVAKLVEAATAALGALALLTDGRETPPPAATPDADDTTPTTSPVQRIDIG